jgi:EpsI family protein
LAAKDRIGGLISMMPSTTNLTPRFLLAAILIAATASVVGAWHGDVIPPRPTMQEFPRQLGAWTGVDRPMDADVLEKLGPGDFLLRDYINTEKPDQLINLYIAYFPSQRAGDTMHSPQNCYPGAGFTSVENTRTTLNLPGHVPFPVNRYVIAKGDIRLISLYWYWAHDRGVASEYWAKYYLIADSIRMNRSDGALVRITTTMAPGETADAAQHRLMPFVDLVLPLQNEFIPR